MAKYKIDYLVGEAKRCKNGFKIGDRIVERNIVIEADTYANLEIELDNGEVVTDDLYFINSKFPNLMDTGLDKNNTIQFLCYKYNYIFKLEYNFYDDTEENTNDFQFVSRNC